jgi:hypothetical protein
MMPPCSVDLVQREPHALHGEYAGLGLRAGQLVHEAEPDRIRGLNRQRQGSSERARRDSSGDELHCLLHLLVLYRVLQRLFCLNGPRCERARLNASRARL